MSRKEQIEQAAFQIKVNDCNACFIDGAEWADANPAKMSEMQELLTLKLFHAEAKLAIAVEALEFYLGQETLSRPKDWNSMKMGGAPESNDLETEDIGYIASEALEKIKEETK